MCSVFSTWDFTKFLSPRRASSCQHGRPSTIALWPCAPSLRPPISFAFAESPPAFLLCFVLPRPLAF
ncbi:hypothetical protein VTH06DRAFT_3058 [Thermothelomyces fergusii]